MKNSPKVLANDAALSSQEEEEKEPSALTKRLQRMRKLERKNARLEKQLASLLSKMNDFSAVRERKPGSPPDPDFVSNLTDKIKEDWIEYLSFDRKRLTPNVKAEKVRLRNKISSSETRLKERVRDVRDKVEHLELKHKAIELGEALSRVVKPKSKSMAKVR